MTPKKQHTIRDIQCDVAEAVHQKYQADIYHLVSCPSDYDVAKMEEAKLMLVLLQSGVDYGGNNKSSKVPMIVSEQKGAVFIFVETNPAGTWIVNHSLGYNPIVKVVDNYGTPVIATITYINQMSLRIDLTTIMSGKAYLYNSN